MPPDALPHYPWHGTVHEVPVDSLVAPVVVVDIRARAEAQREAQVTPDDLRRWRDGHGDVPEGAVVAMLSGWERHLGKPKFRGAGEAGVQHYPAFHAEAALMLLEETSAVGIAIDTLSLDIGCRRPSTPTLRGSPPTAGASRPPRTSPSGTTMVVGAPKHRGGSGGAARVIALV
ncbi:MAG TPA: cyclase family protein [Thermohalobaculum sp.]|nr:cyclase family protein [Thermohalobaculum sp.]